MNVASRCQVAAFRRPSLAVAAAAKGKSSSKGTTTSTKGFGVVKPVVKKVGVDGCPCGSGRPYKVCNVTQQQCAELHPPSSCVVEAHLADVALFTYHVRSNWYNMLLTLANVVPDHQIGPCVHTQPLPTPTLNPPLPPLRPPPCPHRSAASPTTLALTPPLLSRTPFVPDSAQFSKRTCHTCSKPPAPTSTPSTMGESQGQPPSSWKMTCGTLWSTTSTATSRYAR